MKHKRFEENILVDEAYTNYGRVDKNADEKKNHGIAKHFAETLEYEERKKWYHQMPEEPSPITKTLNAEQIEELRKEANSALHGDTLAYETKQNKNGSSDRQWAKTLLNKGAIGDRVAAATILIQDNPLYNLTALRNLINNVKPAKKKDGIVIIDALSELLISDLLIPDTKLRTFEQHALGHVDEMTSGNKQARRAILKVWHFEDQLKELFGTYVEALNKFAQDSVEANREKAVSAMSYLLMHHPEREKTLLTNIINKLGDPSTSVGSKVIYHLCQLLYNHPNMKSVVLTEIEKMLFRTNIAPRAQYYGICFLNQFYLGKDDSRVAENLIRIYFSFFKACVKKGDIDTRLMSAILTGVKRAYPFADKDRLSDTPEHIDAIHKLVHLAPLPTAIHALALLFQITKASKLTSDRYYTALYRKLTSPDIFTTTHSALLFSLIYKSLKQDEDTRRVTAFVKRLLQLCASSAPAQATGLLLMISQVLKDADKKAAVHLHWAKRELKEEIKEEPPKEENVEVKEDQKVDLNGTADSSDGESETKDVEETKKIDLLKGDKRDLLMDDDEEKYVDLKIDDKGNIKPKKRFDSHVTPGWYHAKFKVEKQDPDKKEIEVDPKIQMKKTINMDKVITEYNPFARNPAYSGADHSAYLELVPLATHFHPTVKLFAEKILSDQVIQYTGDPLKDFAGIRFLDRFVFKNPKKRPDTDPDTDVKKVKGSHPKFAIRRNYTAKEEVSNELKPRLQAVLLKLKDLDKNLNFTKQHHIKNVSVMSGIKSMAVNSSSYLNEDAKKIPVDEKFLYDFLQKRRNQQQSDDEDSDQESVTSEDFEQYLDSVTGGKEAANSDEEFDYLAEMEAAKQKRPKKDDDQDASDGEDDEIGDNEDGDDEGDSDGELNISGDEDEPQLSGEEDELLLEDSDDDDKIDVPGLKKTRKGKMKLKLKGKDDLGSLFASAEEFSTLLEDTASNKKQGSSQAVSNTDNASVKQLAWEEKRDRWIKGYNKNVLGKNIKKGNKKFGKPGNTNFSKMAGNAKGGKRKRGHTESGVGGKKKKFK